MIGDTPLYLEFIDNLDQVKLAQKCLQYALVEIAGQLKNISKAADSTKEKKTSQQAHAKLSRKARLEEMNRQILLK